MKTITAVFLSLVIATSFAGVVTLVGPPLPAEAADTTPATEAVVYASSPVSLSAKLDEIGSMVVAMNHRLSVLTNSATTAKLDEIHSQITKLLTATNGITPQSVAEAAAAVAPPQYSASIKSIGEILVSLLAAYAVIMRAIEGWKANGFVGVHDGVFRGLSRPKTADDQAAPVKDPSAPSK
jgi:hypothetical protein